MPIDSLLILGPLFFLTALLYSSVGFGGGTTYIAILFLFNIEYQDIPQIALACNLAVVSGSLYVFSRLKILNLKKILPFIITSIPSAYLGGLLLINKTFFLFILSISLLLSGLKLIFDPIIKIRAEFSTKKNWVLGLVSGAILGFFAGLVGIGGGVFLAPVLYFTGVFKAQEIMAATTFFIFVNSLAGLSGQLFKNQSQFLMPEIMILIVCVILGGQIGSRLSLKRFNPLLIQKLTACLILFVSGRIVVELFL